MAKFQEKCKNQVMALDNDLDFFYSFDFLRVPLRINLIVIIARISRIGRIA
jgi:hypothetical protein